MPIVTQIGQVVHSAGSQQLESSVSCGIAQLRTTQGLKLRWLRAQQRLNYMHSQVQPTTSFTCSQ
eukprot:3333489-Amphidinium_carterae.1